MTNRPPLSQAHGTEATDRGRDRGFALMLTLSVLMVVSLTIAVMEGILSESWKSSRNSLAHVRADWACHGAVVQAAASPPDSISRYAYGGTDVNVTVHNPPVSLLEILTNDRTNPSQTPIEGTLRVLCAEAQSPARDTIALAKWCYLVSETDRPEIRTSWPGVFGTNVTQE